MSVLPLPLDLFDEYVAQVNAQIDRGTQDSFDAALDELVEFHAYFLRSNAYIDDHSNRQNYSLIPGFFFPEFEKWNRRYHSIQRRSASLLDQDTYWFDAVARVPLRLVDKCASTVPIEILCSFLDQNLSHFHRLEDWWKLHISSQLGHVPNLTSPGSLAGYEGQRYERTLRQFVGSIETPNQIVEHVWKWDRDLEDEEERWSRLTQAVPFIQRQLEGTVYLVGASVWYGDLSAVNLFSDALINWRSWYEFELTDDDIVDLDLVTLDLANQKWLETSESLNALQPGPFPTPTPESVVRQLLDHAYADVTILVSSILADWDQRFGKEPTFAAKICGSLMRGEAFDPNVGDRQRGNAIGENPDHLFRNLVRIVSTGEKFRDEGYRGWLNTIARRIDGLTERETVPGRSYTPSTSFELDDFIIVFLLLLMSSFARNPHQGISEHTVGLLQAIAWNEGDDAPARRLRRWLEDSSRFLSELQFETWGRTFTGIVSNEDPSIFENCRQRTIRIFKDALRLIEEQRQERLAGLEASRARLLDFEIAASQQVVNREQQEPPLCWFSEVRCVSEKLEELSCRFLNYPKGRLTDPRMEEPSSNEIEFHSERAIQYLCRSLMQDTLDAANVETVHVGNATEYFEAFRNRERILIESGHEPLLLLEHRTKPHWIIDWMRREARENPRPNDLRIVRDPQQKENGYFSTFNAAKVFVFPIERGASFLLPMQTFQTVDFSVIESKANLVTAVTFESSEDPEKGSLVFHWAKRVEIGNPSVLKIVYQREEVSKKPE